MDDKDRVRCIFQKLYVKKISKGNNIIQYYTIIISACLTLFVLFSNFMLIHGFWKTSRRPFLITTKLFIYLSCIDISTILTTSTYSNLSLFARNLPCNLMRILICLDVTPVCLGAFTFCTISILRLMSLKKPFLLIKSHVVYNLSRRNANWNMYWRVHVLLAQCR